MADKVQFRRDTKARWTQFNPILMEGEVGFETDSNQYKLGDGVKAWNDLPYRGLPAVNQLGFSTSDVVNQRTTTEVDNLAMKNAGVIISGGKSTIETLTNGRLSRMFIDAAFFNIADDVILGVTAVENGLKYDAGTPNEYRRYGFTLGSYKWVDGQLQRTTTEAYPFWITRKPSDPNYNTFTFTGVERMVKYGHIVIFDWDAVNDIIPVGSNTQIGSTDNDIRFGKINPSKYYKVTASTLSDITLNLYKTGVDVSNSTSAQAGLAGGATKDNNSTIRIPVGQTGNGANLGVYFSWSDCLSKAGLSKNDIPYIKDIYACFVYKVLGGSRPNRKPMVVMGGSAGLKTYFSANIIKTTDLPDGSIMVECVYNDIRGTYGGTSFESFWWGQTFDTNTAVTGEDFVMKIISWQTVITTLAEYTTKSGSRIGMEGTISQEIAKNASFNPSLKGLDYTNWATVQKGLASVPMVPYTTEDGLKAGRLPVGTNCRNFFFGAQNTLQAGKSYKIEMIAKVSGIATWDKFSIYIVLGGTPIYNVSRTTVDEANGIYKFTVPEIASSASNRGFILAIQQIVDFTQVVEGNVIVQELSIFTSPINNNYLENNLTKSIVDYISKIVIPDPLRIYQKFYRTDLYAGAIKLATNDGFFVPANTESAPSNMVAAIRGMKVGYAVNCEVYFYKDNEDYQISFYYITVNNKGENRRVVYVTPTKIADGLYKAAFTYTPTLNYSDGNSVDIAIQNTTTGQLLPLSTTLRWKNVSYSQNYSSINGDPTFQQQAVQQTAQDIVNTALTPSSVTEIVVIADENAEGYAFKGNNAIQLALNSITDASASKRYRIYVMPGLYKITNSSQYLGSPGYPSMICMKDYVDIVGHSKDSCIVWAELPYEDADIDNSITGSKIDRILHQTVWNWAQEAYMKNITLVAKNIRYTIHQDDPRSALKHRGYENVDLHFLGDKGSGACWGLGSWNGETNSVKQGKAIATDSVPWSCHNNTNFKYPTKWSFEDYQFIAQWGKTAIVPQNDGSLLNDELTLVGCGFGGTCYKISYNQFWLKGGQFASWNHAEWRIFGHGNAPFLFENTVRGASLRVTSKSKGDTSVVRFDPTSTAFNALIRNPRYPYDTKISIPDIVEITDGYVVKDGSLGLSGWANGCRDVSQEAYAYDSGVVYDSLGKNLGNCSTVNKTLIIEVDGTSYNVIFNKDYTNMSNTSILQEINDVISAVATASLVYIGREYYPEMSDVMEHVMNASATDYIPKGTVLTRVQGGVVRACQTGEKIAGVALDDIPVYTKVQGIVRGFGRMMKRGYISTLNTDAHFVKASTNPVAGTRMKAVAGQLVEDANGECVGIDTNVISINC